MRKEKRALGLWAVLLLALTLVGCGEKSTDELLVGDWRFSKQLSDAELAVMMGYEELPPGMEMSMSIEGTQSYQKDGSYELEFDARMYMNMMGQEVNMAFHVTDSGSWTLNETGLLIEITQASSVEPLDEETRQLLAMDPTADEGFADPPGTETTTTLKVVSDDEMVHIDQDVYIELVMQRQ